VKIRAILPLMALAAFSFAPAAMAQAGSVPPTKFRVIDMRAAIVGTAEAKSDYAQLQSQFAPQTAALDNLTKQADDVAKKMQAGANTLSDEEKARLSRQGQMLQSQYKRAQDQLEEQSNAAQQDMVDGIGRKMMDIVDNYRKENGLDCILGASSDSLSVLSKSAEMDITQEIIKLYDQKYPVKGAPTAAPKPATPPASPAVKKPGGEK
jgi:Skp family chaperone for outer membrane proteins